jgi:hypothetical protein
MLFRDCPDCKHRFFWEDWVCPECGARVDTHYKPNTQSSTRVLFFLAVFGALFCLIGMLCAFAEPGMSDPAPLVSLGFTGLCCIGVVVCLGVRAWQSSEHKWQWMVYVNQHDLRKWDREAK